MSTINNPELHWVISQRKPYGGPAGAVVYVSAYHGIGGYSEERPAAFMPAEIWTMDEAEALAHPWTAFLVQEAKDDLKKQFMELMNGPMAQPKPYEDEREITLNIERGPKLLPKPYEDGDE